MEEMDFYHNTTAKKRRVMIEHKKTSLQDTYPLDLQNSSMDICVEVESSVFTAQNPIAPPCGSPGIMIYRGS